MRLIDAEPYIGKVIASNLYSGVKKLINIDDVPTVSLADHDKQIRDEVISEILNKLCFSEIISYKANDIRRILEQMKGEQNE